MTNHQWKMENEVSCKILAPFLICLRFGFERQLLVRVPQLIPGQALFAISRFATEDGHKRAFNTVFGVVSVFVFALALTEHAVDEGQRFLIVGFVVGVVVFVEDWRLGVSSASDAFDARARQTVFACKSGRKCGLTAANRF